MIRIGSGAAAVCVYLKLLMVRKPNKRVQYTGVLILRKINMKIMLNILIYIFDDIILLLQSHLRPRNLLDI